MECPWQGLVSPTKLLLAGEQPDTPAHDSYVQDLQPAILEASETR